MGSVGECEDQLLEPAHTQIFDIVIITCYYYFQVKRFLFLVPPKEAVETEIGTS